MKPIHLIFFLVTLIGTAQKATRQEPGSNAVLTAATPQDARKFAQNDIKGQSISLFVQGGFAPTVNPSDAGFEKKYQMKIRDFGCTALEYKIISAYNHEIFRYLDSKYGEQWRKEIRKDVIGLHEFTKAKQTDR